MAIAGDVVKGIFIFQMCACVCVFGHESLSYVYVCVFVYW